MTKSVYPNELDSDLELQRVDDNITEISGDVINSLRDAVFSIETTLGINPQGSTSDLVSRINGVIDEDGNVRAAALDGIGLVSLPITNSQIGAGAGIEESKLALDYSTSSINNKINSTNSDVSSLRDSLVAIANQNTLHFAGLNYRHDGYSIDLQNIIISSDNVESALHEIHNKIIDHVNQSLISHNASSIGVSTGFRNISATNVSEALIAFDEISISSLDRNQDEIRDTSITNNNKGQQGSQGNLEETIFASTIFQTDIVSTTNILQVMRPNVARVTSKDINLRALSIGSVKNLRIAAGGVGRDPIDINLASIIPTDDIEDIIFVINTQCSASHYPVSAYNTSGKLTIAHNIPGKQFTIQIKNDISLSAHSALGFGDVTSTVFEWSGTNCSAFINGSRVVDMKPLVNLSYTHAGTDTISPGLGDLSLLGITIGNEGRILCNITNHSSDSTYNGTYYITVFVGNSAFKLADGDSDPITIVAGSFDIEITSTSVNFTDSTNGEIYDIFVENSGEQDGYCSIIKSNRASYGTLSNVSIISLTENFQDNVDWQITNANEIKFLGISYDGLPVIIPTGFNGQLKVFAPDNINSALFQITGNPASGTRTISIAEFSGSRSKLYLSSVHYAGVFGIKTLKFVTDKRNFGGTVDNFTNNILSKTPLEESIDDLRSNGVVRGLDLISSTNSTLLIRGGRAYVDGRTVNVESKTINVNDFSEAKRWLLLDRDGNFFIKSEFDSGFSFEDLTEGDSYGDNRSCATILEFRTNGESIEDGFEVDTRLLIGNIDKKIVDFSNGLNDRITQVQSAVSGSLWGSLDAYQDGYTAGISVASNAKFTELDAVGFAAGNNLITTRRFEFSGTTIVQLFKIFKSVGLTHINVMGEVNYTGSSGRPFGTSGLFSLEFGIAVVIGKSNPQTYEDYVLVKTIDTDVLPSNITIERYVASIPLSILNIPNNCLIDIYPRIRINGSTYADGGAGGDVSPLIHFVNMRIVTSSYSVAGNILSEDGTSQSLATVLGDVL